MPNIPRLCQRKPPNFDMFNYQYEHLQECALGSVVRPVLEASFQSAQHITMNTALYQLYG